MYDKYLTGNTFTVGPTKLPKHKGFLIHNNSTSNLANGFTAYLVNDQGNTLSMNFPLTTGSNYFSNQFYAIPAVTTGVTGIMMS